MDFKSNPERIKEIRRAVAAGIVLCMVADVSKTDMINFIERALNLTTVQELQAVAFNVGSAIGGASTHSVDGSPSLEHEAFVREAREIITNLSITEPTLEKDFQTIFNYYSTLE